MSTFQLHLRNPYNLRVDLIEACLKSYPKQHFIPVDSVARPGMYWSQIRLAAGSRGFPPVAVSRGISPEMIAEIPRLRHYLARAGESIPLIIRHFQEGTTLPWLLPPQKIKELRDAGISSLKLNRWAACTATRHLDFFFSLEKKRVYCRIPEDRRG